MLAVASSAPANTLTIRSASIDEILERAGPLLRRHWDEIALNKQLMRLDPDWSRYQDIENKGNLVVLVAETPGMGLAGYSISFVHAHLHYRNLVVAQNDVIFLDKEWRTAGVGAALLAATEQECKARGARMMMFHAKPETALEKVLPRRGYGVQDVVFSKELS